MFLSFLVVSFVFYLLLLRVWVVFLPHANDYQNYVFLSLPTAYSILSIMLQVIFQRYMLMVVVFFYLLILKLTHPVFFPGLVFPPETGWVHFVLDSPFSLGYCQTSQRGQAGGLGANSVSSIRERAARGPGPQVTLAGVLVLTCFFSFFGKAIVPHARPNVSDLIPGTQTGLSLCPTSHIQLPSLWKTCFLGRPVPAEPLLLPEASSLHIQVSRHNSPRASNISETTLATSWNHSPECAPKAFSQENYLKAQATSSSD